jgi:hypothetical protein
MVEAWSASLSEDTIWLGSTATEFSRQWGDWLQLFDLAGRIGVSRACRLATSNTPTTPHRQIDPREPATQSYAG